VTADKPDDHEQSKAKTEPFQERLAHLKDPIPPAPSSAPGTAKPVGPPYAMGSH
jgi:hypothetical protein